MTQLTQRIIPILAFLLLGSAQLLAQAENPSPYSSSTVDTPPGDSYFATNGVIIVLALVFVALFIFLLLKGRRKV